MKKLFLSHNQLKSLKGIQFFKNLTHLSVANNKLESIEEFSKLQNPDKLECLAVKGNHLIERHPDYQSLLIKYFPNLKELDSNNVQAKSDPFRQQIRHGMNLKREIIPFIYRMDKIIQNLQEEI